MTKSERDIYQKTLARAVERLERCRKSGDALGMADAEKAVNHWRNELGEGTGDTQETIAIAREVASEAPKPERTRRTLSATEQLGRALMGSRKRK